MRDKIKKSKLTSNLRIALMLTMILLGINAAQAAVYTVNNQDDAGAGSLRQAINAANASADNDTINFSASLTGKTIVLSSELSIANNGTLTINGPGANLLSVSGGGTSRVFSINPAANVTIRGITVTGGNGVGAASSGLGGGIFNSGGTVTLTNSTVSNNTANAGGGILNLGVMTLTNTTINANSSGTGGGGIYIASGVMTLTGSTVSNNAANAGGGIYSSDGTITLVNSVINNNASNNEGGGIYNFGILTLTNSTVSGNTSVLSGAGIVNIGALGILTVTNSTVSGNISNLGGGGIFNSSTLNKPNVGNTIIAGNTGGISPDVLGLFNTQGYNLIGNSNGSTGFGAVSDQVGTTFSPINAMLLPLAHNGGPTKTHALAPGSPAIDKGKNFGGLSTDQRGAGYARTSDDAGIPNLDDGTDIGAFEVQQVLLVNKTADTNDGSCDVSDCSLREAIAAANLSPADDTINFHPSLTGQTIVLGGSELSIVNNGTLTINGLGADQLSVSGGGTSRVFFINTGANAAINGITVTGGSTAYGSGIFNNLGGTVTLTNSTVSNNSSSLEGGGITNGGTVVLTNSTISNNSAIHGGGIFNNLGGTVMLTNSTVSDNSSSFGGGIISGGTVTLTNSTISNNSAINGGGIYNNGTLTLNSSTFSGNSASEGGGGIFNFGTAIVGNSIIAGETAPGGDPDLFGSFNSQGYNLIGNGDGSVGFGTIGDQVGTSAAPINPLLGPLQNNGGPTKTHALGCGSPALDAGKNLGALTTDQRGAGLARTFDDAGIANAPDGDGTDIGAFEAQSALVCNTAPVANDDAYSTNEDTSLTIAAPGVLGNDTDGEGDPLTVMLDSGPAHASSFSLNANGSFSYTPNANFNGSDSFTYKASDGSFDSNVATVSITITPVNDAPVVSATPKTQPDVQYSDAIQQVTITASDLETPTASLSIAFSYKRNGGATIAGLPNGMTQGGAGGAWTVSGVAGVPQGAYVISATVIDTGDGSAPAASNTDTFTIVVTRENAVASPQMNNPVSKQVSSPGGTATGTTAQICFDITELADGSLGDTFFITAGSVQISAVGGGSAGGITPSAVTFSGGGIGQARTACFTLNLVNAAPNVYEMKLVIGGDYYQGSGTTAFTVFDPSAGFVSGGGWIINPNTGYRATFGINVKYLRNGLAQGSLLYIEHRPDGDYKVKSTALNASGGFAIVPVTGGYEARIAGKGNFTMVETTEGNYSFLVRMINMGTPGTNDRLGLKLIDPLGQTVADFTFDPVTLGGGNNQVPKK